MRFDHLQNQLPESSSIKEELNKSIVHLENANKDIRSISHQMMPVALEESGLIVALEEMFANSLHFSKISYEYQLLGVNKSERFDPKIEVTIYRVAQELTNNIIKHSNANNVVAQLRKTKSHVIFHVEDDGIGMDHHEMKDGIGMHNIRSRTENVNGDIHFESEGKGTMVDLRIPLKNS
jgi:signal transduction histidine kinase